MVRPRVVVEDGLQVGGVWATD